MVSALVNGIMLNNIEELRIFMKICIYWFL
uniref:Uncharacterized protein n=1 Tax=Arundo donax TaxID=35708 RepID=A0A0A9FCX3_ARUDO